MTLGGVVGGGRDAVLVEVKNAETQSSVPSGAVKR
jgi:hypothetical protein